MISWWYSQGWGIFMRRIFEKLHDTLDFFSFSTILKTLFAPFRQISAGSEGGAAMSSRLSAALDRLFSRIIGFIVRVGILIVGIIVLILQTVLSLVSIVIWPVLPIAPFVGLVLTIVGVTV